MGPRSAAACALAVAACSAQAEVRRLGLDLTVDPAAGSVAVHASVEASVDAGADTVEVLLNRGLQVTAVEADVPLTGFAFRRDRAGTYRYAAAAAPLEIRLAAAAAAPRTVHVRLEYGGTLERDDWGVNMVSPDWVELGLYSGWFPLDPAAGPFAVDVRTRVPDGWTVVGTGRPRLRDGVWHGEAAAASDAVVIASPELRRWEAGAGVAVHAASLDEATAAAVGREAGALRRLLEAWLGPPDGSAAVDLVFSPRSRGGGYARPGLVVMLFDGGPDDAAATGFRRYLAHEIAHLWWRRAPVTSWQDWLNESFAEVSALLAVRRLEGEGSWEGLLARYREAAVGLPPVRGVDRSSEQAFAVLYRKGAVILADLEARVGRDTFLRLLRELAAARASDTAAALAVVERVAGADAAAWLDRALDR